jgi:hypothetical protein
MSTLFKTLTLFITILTLLFTLLISDESSINDVLKKGIEISKYYTEIIN